MEPDCDPSRDPDCSPRRDRRGADHVADTKANRPYQRRDDARAFFRTGDLAIPRRYGATWLVVDRSRSKLKLTLPRAYADARYVLYRLPQ